jgi:hypothetical protein
MRRERVLTLNVLCPIGGYSRQSDQPLMKHVVVEIIPSSVAVSSEEIS